MRPPTSMAVPAFFDNKKNARPPAINMRGKDMTDSAPVTADPILFSAFTPSPLTLSTALLTVLNPSFAISSTVLFADWKALLMSPYASWAIEPIVLVIEFQKLTIFKVKKNMGELYDDEEHFKVTEHFEHIFFACGEVLHGQILAHFGDIIGFFFWRIHGHFKKARELYDAFEEEFWAIFVNIGKGQEFGDVIGPECFLRK